MIAGIADTHAAIWYLYADSRLTSRAKAFVEATANQGNRIGICTISLAEIVYLTEKGRVRASAFVDLLRVLDDVDQVFEVVELTREMVSSMQSVPRDEVPDLPDRILTATAACLRVPIIGCDKKIQASKVASIW